MEYIIIEGLGLLAILCLLYSALRIFKGYIDEKTVLGLLLCISLDHLGNILHSVYIEKKALLNLDVWMTAIKITTIIIFLITIVWFAGHKLFGRKKDNSRHRRRLDNRE